VYYRYLGSSRASPASLAFAAAARHQLDPPRLRMLLIPTVLPDQKIDPSERKYCCDKSVKDDCGHPYQEPSTSDNP
jgi:hypothetical protein